MNLLRPIIWILGFAALFVTGRLLAQAAGEPAWTELRFMSWEVEQEGLFVTVNTRDYLPVTAPAYEFGKAVRVKTGAPLRIYEQVKTDDGPGYRVLGETILPPGCRTAQVYLIRNPDRDGRRDYRLIAMSTDAEAFPAGKIRIFNFTPWLAALRINQMDTTLGSLEWRIVDATPDRKHRVVLQASLQLPEGGWTAAVRDLVTLRENYRGSVTLLHTRRAFDPADPGAVRAHARMFIQTSSEYLNPPPEPAK